MVDILEPIEEKDLDLRGKFKGENPESILQKKENEKEVLISSQEKSASEKDASYQKILSKVSSNKNSDLDNDDEIEKDSKGFLQRTDAESQISHLVDVAGQKGVVYAVKLAKHLEDNYILDMFHDKLMSEELHDALLKRGLLKEI